jgi:hypothetical protein
MNTGISVRDQASHVATVCGLLATASDEELAEAGSLVVESVREMLRSLGYGLHRVGGDPGRVRGQEPAFRIDSSTDYVVRDVRRAAGLARARAGQSDVGLCTSEPLEEDPMGVVLDLLELEVSPTDLQGAVEVYLRHQEARSLESHERRQSG